MRVDPRLRVLYLGAVAIGAFLIKDLRIAAALLAAHAIAWLALGQGVKGLVRQLVKLWGFTLLVIGTYAVTSDSPDVDRWVPVWKFHLNAGAALIGVLMVLRVMSVILASRIARVGDSRAIALGVKKLGAPPIIAASLDAVLALLGGGGGGGGVGGGGGGGRRRREAESAAEGRGERAPREGFLAGVKRIAKGDVGPIVNRLERHIARAEDYVAEEHGDLGREVVRDVAVIAGITLTMLGIKALKILPTIPFAPGHKLVLLTPLYLVAALKTRSRLGATLTGLVMGSVAFLMGDGRYGIFEIAKHIAPGLLCDLLVPILIRPGKPAGVLVCSMLGGIMGVGRFATIFCVMLAVQPPAMAWAILMPGLLVHTTFGILSGLVSAPLVRAATRPRPDATTPEASAAALETGKT